MIEVFGGWPGNALENKCTVTITSLLSYQCKRFPCGKYSYNPCHPRAYAANNWLTNGQIWFLRLRTTSASFSPGCVSLSIAFYCFIDSCDSGCRYYCWQQTVWFSYAQFSWEKWFPNRNISAKVMKTFSSDNFLLYSSDGNWTLLT